MLPLSGFWEQAHPLRTPGPHHPISPRASETQLRDSQWGGYRHASNRREVTVCLQEVYTSFYFIVRKEYGIFPKVFSPFVEVIVMTFTPRGLLK